MERKEIIIPSMTAFVKEGNWFSKAPIGYDHYGPRVKDGKFLKQKQKIVVNETGKILQEAWQWKLSGLYSDVQILAKLNTRGVILDAKKISSMWRNPFYCGVNKNKLAGEPVKGKWEPLISINDFMKVQELLEKNPSGYQHKKEVDERPLTRLLRCDSCDSFMVGYRNNQKNLHYYRCLKCNGVSLSAKPRPKTKKKDAEQLFIELLQRYQVSDSIRPLIELQLTKLFYHYNSSTMESDRQIENQYSTVQEQLKQLKIRYGIGQIDKETYEVTLEHLNEKLLEISKELNNGKVKISNLEELLSKSLKKLENLSKIWGSSDLEQKRSMHKTLFPEGIFFNAQKHEYLTRKTNQFIELVASISSCYEANKKGSFQNFIENSRPVPESRLELPTFGL
ncbi:MAG: recombinase family protein [Bacteroidetes bacterium]|nr:recombinase family protein [Bacteroidota bacterium]